MTPNAGFLMLGHCHVVNVHHFLFSSLWYKSSKLEKQDSMKDCKFHNSWGRHSCAIACMIKLVTLQ